MSRCVRSLALLTMLGLGCGDSTASEASESSAESSETSGPSTPDYEAAGPYAVGHRQVRVNDETRMRDLPVEFWFPAQAGGDPSEMVDFAVDAAHRDVLAPLVAAAPEGCTTPQTQSVRDAPLALAESQYPLVIFSHCHSCTRYSTFSIAERLASHGFIVAAVDHLDNTLYDELVGTPASVNAEFLQTRGADVRALLDAIETDAAPLPAALQGNIDLSRVGMYGHSFGAATTGLVLQDDDRVKSGAAIAAPVESPLLAGVAVAGIDEPMLWLLATEDNSITEIGNNLLRDNYAKLGQESWLIELVDAGHWSFTNICGITDFFMPGCGSDTRQTIPNEEFVYLDNDIAREIAASRITAFFAWSLRGEAQAADLLSSPHSSGATRVQHHD